MGYFVVAPARGSDRAFLGARVKSVHQWLLGAMVALFCFGDPRKGEFMRRVSPRGQRVIGIRHGCKVLREEGLIPEGVFFPAEAAEAIRQRGGRRAMRWYLRGLADLAQYQRTGRLPRRLRDRAIRVRVGTEVVEIRLDEGAVARVLRRI